MNRGTAGDEAPDRKAAQRGGDAAQRNELALVRGAVAGDDERLVGQVDSRVTPLRPRSWSRALDADVAGLVVGLRVEVEGRTAGHEHVVDGLELIEHVHERCDTGKGARPVEVGEAAVPEAG